MFDAKKIKDDIVKWIQDWFKENGDGCNAVIGISGGKDSAVVAALCVEALGNQKVIGVLMPDGKQEDIEDAYSLVKHLDIYHIEVNIEKTINSVFESIIGHTLLSVQAEINLPPRIRMATLYAVSQSLNGRVANTCNLSENWIGYSTRYGDNVGDFSPLANLTVTEVKDIGRELGLPEALIDKTPADGLSEKTDEEHFGFTYDTLDKYIRTGVCENKLIKDRIDELHKKNLFKMIQMPEFYYSPSGSTQNVEEVI